MGKKGSSKAGSVSGGSNGDVAAGRGKAKKPAVSRAEKAGLTMSVSKVHNHLLRHKQAKGVTRVSVSAPVWITAAIEFFAAELLEQARERGWKRNPDPFFPIDLTHAGIAVPDKNPLATSSFLGCAECRRTL